ncbi:MAG: NADPH-dependent FMN reductase [Actinomycetota bacterium]|nr:NADPH-dependent FMN reductase [Actinomycetota bacterium]
MNQKTTDQEINVLGFAGSLRKGSYNRAALRVTKKLAPEGMNIEIFELDNIPLYNGDVEARGFPASVQLFKDKIQAADALLIVTPEYNYSISGVLKNAIDWASRPPTQTPLIGKPVAIMGATVGGFGTVRAQLVLRQILFSVKCLVLVHPEVYISRAQQKFDEEGNLIDEETAVQIKNLLVALYEWALLFKISKARRTAA